MPLLVQAHRHDLLVAGGWGATVDVVAWLMGFLNMIYLAVDQTGTLPLVDLMAEAGLDAILSIDPQVTNLEEIKRKVDGRLALWGGNGYGTVERGTEAEVRAGGQKAMEVLAPGGGFILSPVENVRDTSQHT